MQPTGELSWRISAHLREWQNEALDAWRAEGDRGVAAVVTGGGKTIFAYACMLDLAKRRANGQRSQSVKPSLTTSEAGRT